MKKTTFILNTTVKQTKSEDEKCVIEWGHMNKAAHSPSTNLRRQLFVSGVSMVASVMVTNIIAEKATADSTSLDFSFPKYDTKMQGFGDGSEAYSNRISTITTSDSSVDTSMTDPGSNEKEKQQRSMELAEQSRQAALAKKKAEAKARADEDRRRAQEKKAKNAERFASIFN